MKSISFTERAWSDHAHWQQFDPSLVAKVNTLIKECLRTPFEGLGKPEPLRGELAGFWSRRISAEHRFVYQVRDSGAEQMFVIISCRFHYQKLGKNK